MSLKPGGGGSGGGSSSPTTTVGDMIVRGASVDQRLAIGTSGQVLMVSGGAPAWGDAPWVTATGTILTGRVLAWDGSAWVATALSASYVGAVPTGRTLAGLDLSVDRSAAALVAALQASARTLPESLPVGATWTESAGVGTADDATLTLTLPGSTVATSFAGVPRLTAPHNRDPWQIEVTARLLAFTGGSTTTWAVLCVANSSGDGWVLAQSRGDRELSIFSNAGFVTAVSGAFALDGTDRLRIKIRDGVVTVYTGDGTNWRRRYHGDIGGSLPGATSGDFSLVSLHLVESSGASGTVTAQWSDVIVRGL